METPTTFLSSHMIPPTVHPTFKNGDVWVLCSSILWQPCVCRCGHYIFVLFISFFFFFFLA